jgi:hypothetical protein
VLSGYVRADDNPAVCIIIIIFFFVFQEFPLFFSALHGIDLLLTITSIFSSPTPACE